MVGPCGRLEESANLLRDYWEGESRLHDIDVNAAYELIQKHVRRTGKPMPIPTFDVFIARLKAFGRSAPGPDGLIYAYYLYAPISVQKALYNLCVHALKGGALPAEFNFAYLICIPKGEKAEDPQLLARSPEETRPSL